MSNRETRELEAAVIQTRPVFGECASNTETALASVPTGCDLAVLPELFQTGYQFLSRDEAMSMAEVFPDGPTCARLLECAAATGTTLVAGLAERDGDALYNSALLARPDGSWDRYRKVHLFWNEKDLFDAGDLGFPVFEACGTTIGLMICFDWLYPEAARTLALGGAEIICHPSNLILPNCPNAMVTRCLENRVFGLTSNRVGREDRGPEVLSFIGLSQIMSPRGERLAAADHLDTGVITATLDLDETDKRITPRNDIWADRRLDAYRL